MQTRSWYCTPLLLVTACQALWGGFSDPNAKYCGIDTAPCPEQQYCELTLHSCLPLCPSGDCDMAAGSTSDLSASVDMAVTSTMPPAFIDLVGVGNRMVAGVSADFDKDGSLDLAVLSSDGTNGWLTTLYGDGQGRFTVTNPSYTVDSQANSIATGELSGDAQPDLVVPGGASSNYQIFVNRGAKNPLMQRSLNGFVWSGGVSVYDLNKDGRDDIILVLRDPA